MPRLPEHCIEYARILQWPKDKPFGGKLNYSLLFDLTLTLLITLRNLLPVYIIIIKDNYKCVFLK